MKKITFLLLLLAFYTLTSNVLAQKEVSTLTQSPQPVFDIYYATAEFSNLGLDETTTNKVSMDDTAARYEHNVDGVNAQFFVGYSRDLVVSLVNSRRYVRFDFREPVSLLPVSQIKSTTWWYDIVLDSEIEVQPEFIILGAYYAKENCSPVERAYNCDFETKMVARNWRLNGVSGSHTLQWGPDVVNKKHLTDMENASTVNVNYSRDDKNRDVFTITPVPNQGFSANRVPASGRIIAGLNSSAKDKPVRTAGQYVMPFTLVIRQK
jgi:hypothetical protein